MGGMENGIVNLVNRHDPKRVDADVLCLRQRGEFAERIDAGKIRFTDPAIHNRTGVYQEIRTTARAVQAGHYDIVHSHSWATLMQGFFGARLGGCKTFVHGEHGTLYLDKPRRRFIQRQLFRRSATCLTVSAHLRDEICEVLGLSSQHFDVILNGVDTKQFRPDPDAIQRLRSMLGIGADSIVAGSVGRLVPVKDYGTMIRAFAATDVQKDKNAHLVLMGGGPEDAMLRQLAQESGAADRISFLGPRDDVAELMPGLDMFILPSIHEGMSNTLLEAAACGVSCIASAIPANCELLEDQNTGRLFPTGDHEALASILTELVNDEAARRQLAKASLDLVENSLSLDHMVGNYEDLYERLIPGHGERVN